INAENRPATKAPEALGRTIDRVGRAFKSEDSGEIERCLSEPKVYLSLKPGGEGYFGSSQAKFILDRLFNERRTDSFTYNPHEVEVSDGASARFRAEWSYVPVEATGVVTEELRFKLDRVSRDEWRVSEIRAQSR
ncbi:MAG TPA: hypothetical protein VIG29_02560, partial [Vicinamibacteria bacterium]